jgi:cell division protein FtsB
MRKLWKVVSNKFLVTGIAFAAWMIFFDQNNWTAQKERNNALKDTERNIAYLNEEIEGMEKEYKELTTNPERLEQYARERYKMKKDDEDIYIVER